MTLRWCLLVCAALLARAAIAAPNTMDVVRDLATRVGPIVGSAEACDDIDRSRIQAITDKFAAVIQEVSADPATRSGLTQTFDRNVKDGTDLVTSKRMDCAAAERQLADLERSLGLAKLSPAPATHGITDNEIRFGIVGPFTGAARELGRQMKLGIDTAFGRANEAGGVSGRLLKLIAADDGYDPGGTLGAMKQLYEGENVFGFIGNVGTPTAAVGIPYALQHKALFFGAFTGAGLLRNDPPDRYVFNYRASYAEETDAVVRYLIRLRHLQPRQIVVFAQQDSYGDAGFAGVAKAFRALGVDDSGILRLGYKRNTVDVDDAINQLRLQKTPVRAIVMVATYRAAAKFIEKTHDTFPGMIYTNVSFVGSTELANELMLLGPRFTEGVVVTQVVPAVSGSSSEVLDYKNALAKYFPGETPDYVSLEGYVAASVLTQALTRTGPQLDAERLVDTLENMRNLDLGLGTPLNFGRAAHQASHKVWGTALDDRGKYQSIELE